MRACWQPQPPLLHLLPNSYCRNALRRTRHGERMGTCLNGPYGGITSLVNLRHNRLWWTRPSASMPNSRRRLHGSTHHGSTGREDRFAVHTVLVALQAPSTLQMRRLTRHGKNGGRCDKAGVLAAIYTRGACHPIAHSFTQTRLNRLLRDRSRLERLPRAWRKQVFPIP